jgi:hypothetical protein
MRARTSIALLACTLLTCTAALLAAGCGKQDDSTPVACLEGADVYVKALEAAPGAVLVGGKTPISDCIAENQKAGDLAGVGEALVEAATRLNAEARAHPGGDANLQLGYLLGAVQRGADRTEGVHTDLVRRLAVAARFAPGTEPLPPEFISTYRRGFDAGRERG